MGITYSRVFTRRVRPKRLYFAVEDGYLSESDFQTFVTRWNDAKLPVIEFGGFVDLQVNELLEMQNEIAKLKLPKKLVKNVLTAAERVQELLGG